MGRTYFLPAILPLGIGIVGVGCSDDSAGSEARGGGFEVRAAASSGEHSFAEAEAADGGLAWAGADGGAACPLPLSTLDSDGDALPDYYEVCGFTDKQGNRL